MLFLFFFLSFCLDFFCAFIGTQSLFEEMEMEVSIFWCMFGRNCGPKNESICFSQMYRMDGQKESSHRCWCFSLDVSFSVLFNFTHYSTNMHTYLLKMLLFPNFSFVYRIQFERHFASFSVALASFLVRFVSFFPFISSLDYVSDFFRSVQTCFMEHFFVVVVCK